MDVATRPNPVLAVAPDIWSVEMPLPSGIQQTSRSYLIDGGVTDGVTVVDPGWPLDGNLDRLRNAVASIGRRLDDVAQVFSTHAHLDHFGMAGDLRHATGARVTLPLAERSHVETLTSLTAENTLDSQAIAWGVPYLQRRRLLGGPPERLNDDDVIVDVWCQGTVPLGWADSGWAIVETPGHTSGSSCLVHHGRRVIFTGDSLLWGQTPGLGMGGTFRANAMNIFAGSMSMLSELDGYLALPGHGSPFSRLADAAHSALAHHVSRREQITGAAVKAKGPLSTWELAQEIDWRGGFESLGANRLRSALRHVDIYRQSSF